MKMTKDNIKMLIDRYFDTATTLEEEQQLGIYFNSEDVAEELLHFREYFAYLQQQRAIKAPENLESDILQKIKENPQQKSGYRTLVRTLSKIAAILIFGVGIWYFIPKETESSSTTASAVNWSKYEVKSEEEALKIMKMALLKTSASLKEGAGIAVTEITTTKQRWSYLK